MSSGLASAGHWSMCSFKVCNEKKNKTRACNQKKNETSAFCCCQIACARYLFVINPFFLICSCTAIPFFILYCKIYTWPFSSAISTIARQKLSASRLPHSLSSASLQISTMQDSLHTAVCRWISGGKRTFVMHRYVM